MGGDIIVTGQRPASSPLPDPNFSMDLQILIDRINNESLQVSYLPSIVRTILDIKTSREIDSAFDAHHTALVKLAIAKLAKIPEFKTAIERQNTMSLDIIVQRDDNLGNREGYTDKPSPGGVYPGNTVTIHVGQYNHGGPVSDQQFVEIVMHEYIHSFGNAVWDARLDATNSTWDRDLFFQLGLNNLIGPNSEMMVDQSVRSMVISDLNGGDLYNSGASAVMVGVSTGNTFHLGVAGDAAIGADGNDNYVAQLGGGYDTIQDDGGSDSLAFAATVSPSSLSARWSPDGNDLSVFVDGSLEAIILAAKASGSVEQVNLGGSNYSLASFITGNGSAPVAPPQTADFYGSVNAGLITSVSASDADGDILHYALLGVTGAFSDLPWYVNEQGLVFTGFNRADNVGNDYTDLTVLVSDGVSSTTTDFTVHWGYSGDYNPWILNAITPPTPVEQSAILSDNMIVA